MTKNTKDTVQGTEPKKLTDAEQKQKVKNMEKEAKSHKELGEGQPGVVPTEKGEESEALNQAEAAGQAGETNIVAPANPANEIEPPRSGEPTIETVDGEEVGVKHVWDMNFANARNNIEGLGHAFASVGVDFTAAPENDSEDRQYYHYILSEAAEPESKKKPKEIAKGKLISRATVDDVYGVFLDYCLKFKPVYLGNFGARATKKD